MNERFFRERKLLYPSEDLFESLSLLNPPFRRLKDLHSVQQSELQHFLCSTFIRKNTTLCQAPLFLHEPSLRDILNENIKGLLGLGLVKYVQTHGFEIKNGMLNLRIYNFGRTALEESQFKELLRFLPTHDVVELVYNYTMVLEVNEQHIQVTGPSLHETFNSKIGEKRKKAELKQLDYGSFIINRFQIYYCTHFGRDPGIFRKNFFFQKGVKSSGNEPEELARIVSHCTLTIYNEKALHMSKQQIHNFEVLFKEFIVRLRKCFKMDSDRKGKRWSPFSRLLHHHCPLPANYRPLRRQVESCKSLPKEDIRKCFDQLYSNAQQYRQIVNLLVSLLRQVLPIQFFGRQNTQTLQDMMTEFVSMKRYENFKIEDILSQMDVFEIGWLKDTYNPKHKKHIIARRRKIIGRFVCLLFNSLLVPVLKYNFYITEQHKQANRIFYYRKPLWFLISTLALASFSQDNIKQISTIENLEKNNYPQGKLRIMPKKGTFRPIITFNRRNKVFQGSKLTLNLNQILTDTQLVLRNLKNILGQKLGYCVFDNHQISKRYDAFVQKWRSSGSPPLSFFTLDIKKCYDSINPQRLLQLIKETKLIQEIYLIVKYLRMYRNKKPLNNQQSLQYYFNLRERATAVPLSQNPVHIRQANRPPSIHIHTTRSRLITREVIIDHLSHLCEASLISYHKRKWIQRFGIPQGLNVSGVLCSLYFAYLEDMFVKVEQGILMRLTDDYLYIGPEGEARQVLEGLLQCSKKAEFEFNQDKVTGNFESPHIKSLWKKDMFVWIGKQINIKTLEMFPVADSEPKRLLFSMNVNIPRKTMRNFLKNKLKSLLTNQFESYFKPCLFPKSNLVTNIRIFSKLSLDKFFPFLEKLVSYRLPDLKKTLLKILQIALHEFIVYACYLFEEKMISTRLYYELMGPALREFEGFFKGKRYLQREMYKMIEGVFRNRAVRTERGLIQHTE